MKDLAKPGHLSHSRLDHRRKEHTDAQKSRSMRRHFAVKKIQAQVLDWKREGK